MAVKFHFYNKELIIYPASYSNNNNLALLRRREDEDEEDYYGVVSVNTYMPLPNNMAAIKDYSENEGILKALIEQDIVEKATSYISSGYVDIPVVKVKHQELLEEIKKYYDANNLESN